MDITKADIAAVLVDAFRTGHAWDPQYPNLAGLDLAAVQKMDGSERDAKDLIASRQGSDINADYLVAKFHAGRESYEIQRDGDIGPATRALVEIPRCPLPDFAPPPNATFHYDDPDLQAAVESQQAAAALVGSYWRSCDPQRPGIHSLVIGIDARNAPSNWKANQAKILEARRACAAEIGVAVRYVINPESTTGLQQLQVYRNIPGGTIGLNYFPQSNSCGKIPNGSLDTGYNPSEWIWHAVLGIHEAEGHGFGFQHSRGGIMNPSILKVAPTYKNDPSWAVAVRYYGGKPIDAPPPTDPTDPDDPTPPPSDVISEFVLDSQRYGIVRLNGTKPPDIRV